MMSSTAAFRSTLMEDYAGHFHRYEQTNARASHILVKSEEDALKIKEDIDTGRLEFSEAAMRFSTCNSASQGGIQPLQSATSCSASPVQLWQAFS